MLFVWFLELKVLNADSHVCQTMLQRIDFYKSYCGQGQPLTRKSKHIHVSLQRIAEIYV